MNAREFLDVADELIAGLSEGRWRSAVSRAYYALFHVARLLLGGCGFAVPQSDRAHIYLSRRLMNSGHPDITQVGMWLDDLRGIRNVADYELDEAVSQTETVANQEIALKAILLLEEAATLPHVLAQFTIAMRDYERDVLRDVTWHGS